MYTSRLIRTRNNSYPTSRIRCTREKTTTKMDNHSVAVRDTKPGPEQKKNVRRSLGKLSIPVEIISPGQMAISWRVAPRHRLQLRVCRLDGRTAEDRLARPLQLRNRTIALAVIAVDTRGDNVLPVAPASLTTRHDMVESEVVRREPLTTILSAQKEINGARVATRTRDNAETSVAQKREARVEAWSVFPPHQIMPSSVSVHWRVDGTT